MKKLTFLPILLLLLLNMNCEKNTDSGHETSIVPKPLVFSLNDPESRANLLFGNSAVYLLDSVKIFYQGLTGFIPIEYDTMRKAITLGIAPLVEQSQKICFLKLSDYTIDTIKIHYRDVEFHSAANTPYYSYSFSFEYNSKNICDSCKWDTVYNIYR